MKLVVLCLVMINYLGQKLSPLIDRKNEEEGKETAIDRTRRLFYVTCSRTQSSLAIVLYTNEKYKVMESVKELNWFDSNEIIEINYN